MSTLAEELLEVIGYAIEESEATLLLTRYDNDIERTIRAWYEAEENGGLGELIISLNEKNNFADVTTISDCQPIIQKNLNRDYFMDYVMIKSIFRTTSLPSEVVRYLAAHFILPFYLKSRVKFEYTHNGSISNDGYQVTCANESNSWGCWARTNVQEDTFPKTIRVHQKYMYGSRFFTLGITKFIQFPSCGNYYSSQQGKFDFYYHMDGHINDHNANPHRECIMKNPGFVDLHIEKGRLTFSVDGKEPFAESFVIPSKFYLLVSPYYIGDMCWIEVI